MQRLQRHQSPSQSQHRLSLSVRQLKCSQSRMQCLRVSAQHAQSSLNQHVSSRAALKEAHHTTQRLTLELTQELTQELILELTWQLILELTWELRLELTQQKVWTGCTALHT